MAMLRPLATAVLVLAMCFVGVLLAQVGTDVQSGVQRFTFNLDTLYDGINLVSVALGCFGIDRTIYTAVLE